MEINNPGRLKETRRLRRGLKSWQERVDRLAPEQREILRRGLTAWIESAAATGTRFTFTMQTACTQFLEGVRSLGMIPKSFKAIIDTQEPGSARTKAIVQTLEQLGLKDPKVNASEQAEEFRLVPIVKLYPFTYESTLCRALHVALVTLCAET